MGFVIIRHTGAFCIVQRTEKSLLCETERALFDSYKPCASAVRALAELRSFGLIAPMARGLAIVSNAKDSK